MRCIDANARDWVSVTPLLNARAPSNREIAVIKLVALLIEWNSIGKHPIHSVDVPSVEINGLVEPGGVGKHESRILDVVSGEVIDAHSCVQFQLLRTPSQISCWDPNLTKCSWSRASTLPWFGTWPTWFPCSPCSSLQLISVSQSRSRICWAWLIYLGCFLMQACLINLFHETSQEKVWWESPPSSQCRRSWEPRWWWIGWRTGTQRGFHRCSYCTSQHWCSYA